MPISVISEIETLRLPVLTVEVSVLKNSPKTILFSVCSTSGTLWLLSLAA